MIHPWGICLPRFRATRTLPSATTEVAKSSSRGGPSPAGTAKAIGLVLKKGFLPPKGAVLPPGGRELHIVIPIIPC